MSQKDRLPSGGRINRAIVLSGTFHGRKYQGYQGDTLASALLANSRPLKQWVKSRRRQLREASLEV
jgi:sarcosine oxidase subunit alpha